jgi:hypothetical protein
MNLRNILFWIGLAILIIVSILYEINRQGYVKKMIHKLKPDKYPDIEKESNMNESSADTSSTLYRRIMHQIYQWYGRTLLYLNMRGDALVYNESYEKGFMSKIFDGVTNYYN